MPNPVPPQVGRPPQVFISYSHDSAEHEQRVLGLSERLRQDGLDAQIDQYARGTLKTPWARWMLDMLDWADAVVLICTETYYRRFRGKEVPDRGFGVDWEGNLITNEVYEGKSLTGKFFPAFFHAAEKQFIPEPVRGRDFYLLDSEAGYQALKNALTGGGLIVPGAIGPLRVQPSTQGAPLQFPPASNQPGPAPARPSTDPGAPAPRPAASPALAIWQKRLAFLQLEEAKASDAGQKFTIQQQIEEARAKIAELGGGGG